MKKKWKLILGGAVITMILLSMIIGQIKPVEAKVLDIAPRSVVKTFKETGKVVAGWEQAINTLYGGRVLELAVAEGDSVQKGQLLALLDTREIKLQLQQLEGELKSLQGSWEQEKAKIALDKMKVLYEAGAISRQDYEDAQRAVNSPFYSGKIEALRAQMELMVYRMKDGEITAPADGVVAKLEVKTGDLLAMGQQLMTLIQTEAYLVEVFVLTEDAIKIQPGMKVELVQDNRDEDQVFPGSIERVAPAAIERVSSLGLLEQRLKVTVKPDIPSGVALKPGFSLDVVFETQRQEQRLVVPKTVLFPYQEGDAVWVVRKGKAEIQPVVKGFENERDIVIEQGLEQGDAVILNPQLEGLKPGARITVK